MLPIFEHMGAKVVDERPYEITPLGRPGVWIYDFGLRCPAEALERAGEAFADVFLGVWSGELEDDRLNGLVGQLLQVTRAEGDPSSLRRNPVQLDELVRQLVDDSLMEAAAHGCQVKFENREPVSVEGDAELLRQRMRARQDVRRCPQHEAPHDRMARDADHAARGIFARP